MEERANTNDIEVRRQAVLRLGDCPEGVSIAEFARILLKALKDQSWRVRKTAVEILLEKYPVDSYMGGVIGLLHLQDNAGARNSAIEILTRLGHKATDYLMEAFKTSNEDARKFIVDIIGEVGDRKALSLLIGALNDEDINVRTSAVEHLGSMKERSVVDALIEMLQSGDVWTAYPAAEALGKIGDERAVFALKEALEIKTLREPAIRALARLHDAESLESIVPFIQDRSKAVQHEAVCALAAFYNSGVPEERIADALKKQFGKNYIEVLLEHARSSRESVKSSAILILGMLKEEKALRPLLAISTDENFADNVRKALVYIGRNAPESLLPLFEERNIEHVRFLSKVTAEISSPIYFEPMKNLLDNEDGHARALAAIGLANMGDPRAIDSIKALLVDPYPDVQEAAITALGRLRDHINVDEVIATLESENPVLRKNVLLLLGKLGSESVVSALGSAMHDEEDMVRKAAVKALSEIKSRKSLVLLATALTDEDPDIRVTAALALGESGDPAVFDSLALLLADLDDMVKVAAIKALGMIEDQRAVPRLTSLLSSDNGLVVTSAMESLGRLGGGEARRALTDMLFAHDKEFRRTAIMSLARFDNVEHLLLPFLRDDDWATRVSAIEALMGKPQEKVRNEVEALIDEENDPVVRKALDRYLNV